MSVRPADDVIDGATPLESGLAQVRPRLYLTRQRFEELSGLVGSEPYGAMFARVLQMAEQGLRSGAPLSGVDRGHGCMMPHLAMAYRVTGEGRFLKAADEWLRAIAAHEDWGTSLIAGHILGGVGIAYDWLHEDMPADTRDVVREALHRNGRRVHEFIGLREGWCSGALACNHLAVVMGGQTAAACALYGDVPNIGPWLRLCQEKVRVMAAALGPDGASQEGIAYGQYYNEFFIKAVVLVRDLLGVDLFGECEYMRNMPAFYLHSSLPRESWTPQSCHVNFGDGVRHNWYGPDSHLRMLASVYRDPHAQWLADAHGEAGLSSGSASLLNLAWYDPSVPSRAPDDLPTFRRFEDKDVVFVRSGWKGADEALLGFKCGPHFGHHALRRYTGEIGGGHMNPNAGSFQLVAHGERLISGDGYFRKRTEYQNTLLVDGIGQTGEGGEWFESVELRRTRRAPFIICAEQGDAFDHVIGDVAPAYATEAGLRKFLRHVYYLRPACWVLVDDVESASPSRFELLFHSDLDFDGAGANVWTATGSTGALRLTALLPEDVEGEAGRQAACYVDGSPTREFGLLRLRNAQRTDRTVFVTVLQAHAAGGPAAPLPTMQSIQDGRGRRFRLALDRLGTCRPALVEAG